MMFGNIARFCTFSRVLAKFRTACTGTNGIFRDRAAHILIRLNIFVFVGCASVEKEEGGRGSRGVLCTLNNP
jgi:hypothetical protein